ncbi:YraN family protein [Oxalobacteraceae bacterium OM1]|nr:YraN family protein [Oxalobacteraceae bacterium OM1]
MGLLDTLKRPRTAKQQAGDAAEDTARRYLEARGMSLQERNFRCKGGELDLVMQEGKTLVFVEVRQRSGDGFGGAAASVTPHKQRRLIVAAHVYLQRYTMPPPCRFDIVAIDNGRISWIRDAFGA